jgi:hypothetical protein
VIGSLPQLMFLHHLIHRTYVKPLQPCQGGCGEVPRLAAIKEDGFDDRLIKFGGHPRCCILPTQYLPYSGPNSPCLPQLLPDGLCIIIVLRKQAAEVFEHLDLFQHCSVNIELAPQGKG